MNSISEEKTELRKIMKKRLREVKMLKGIYQTQSELAAERFMNYHGLQDVDTVLCFVGYGTEINTEPLIDRLLESGRKVALPVTENGKMTFRLLTGDADAENWKKYLVSGEFGIPVPLKSAPLFDFSVSSEKTLCILPGLAFDEAGHRLGKGKGFYDRYLSSYPDLLSVGYAFDFQIVSQVPVEPTDISCSAVVTDLRTIDFNQT